METSYLSRLPIELRWQIYSLVLKQENSIVVCSPSDCPPSQYHGSIKLSTTSVLHTPSPHPLTLAQTCTQLRFDATEIFFLSNRFAMALPLSDSIDFRSKVPADAKFDQYVENVQMFLAEVHHRVGTEGEIGRKALRLNLDLGILPIRRLEFHGEHKLVGSLLVRLRDLGKMYRSTTSMRPRITVSICFSWYATVRDPVVSSQFVERRIGIELDIENGYKSLHEAIVKVKRESSGARNVDEIMLELDGATDVGLGLYDFDPSKYLDDLSKVSIQAQRAIEVMRVWQEQLVRVFIEIERDAPYR
jgi:hypothetical protein